MVKAGKQTLALASRYSPLAATRICGSESRRPLSEVCRKSECATTPDSTAALQSIRAEFCEKYKAKLEEYRHENYIEDSDGEAAELRMLYRKLRGVVPSLSQPSTTPVTSLDVVLGAIDYIRDLHEMLEDKFPSNVNAPSVTKSNAVPPALSCKSGRSPLTQLENRRPDFLSQLDSISSEDSLSN